MAITSINYDEGSRKKDLGYKSVEISYDSGKRKKIFKSGNFVKDWYDCRKFMITKLSETEYTFMHSSTVDHFIMDGGKKLYDTTFLYTDGGTTGYLEYDKNKLLRAMLSEYNNEQGIEFFVKKGTKPTWEELRVLCGDKTKKKK
jgi:hypothetical protein